MEFIAAVAIGLNPYAGSLLLTALASRTTHLPLGPLVAPSSTALHAAMVLAALGLALDLTLGKLPRWAARCRQVSQAVAAGGAALAALALTHSAWPPLTVAGAAGLAYLVASLVSGAARRGSQSPAWCGWGHVPVLMAAATGSATIVPLAVARLPIGISVVALALGILLASSAVGSRADRPSPARVRSAVRPTLA